MPAADRLSQLVDDVYDAALDPTLWPDVLVSIGRFVGGDGGGIVSKDTVSNASTPNHHFGVDPHFVRIYAETHSKFDPLATLPCFDIEHVMSIPQLVPYEEFCQGRFFHEWMGPQRWVDTASCVLEKSASSFSFITVLRHQSSGLVDGEMRRRMRLIAPRVRRAVLVGKTLERRATEAATLAAMLDRLSAGVILVTASGRIVHANAAAHEILCACDVLRSIGGRVAAGSRQSEQVLSAAVAAAGRHDDTVGAAGIAVPLVARDGTRHVAHVLPMASGARRDGSVTPSAVAAVFVHRAELEAPAGPEIIAKFYNLTPTELRVLLAIVQVGGVPESAEALGIGEATVKTHLHRLFGKTGASRQADLVKLVAGFANPLVH